MIAQHEDLGTGDLFAVHVMSFLYWSSTPFKIPNKENVCYENTKAENENFGIKIHFSQYCKILLLSYPKYTLVLDKRPKLQWHNEIFVIFMNPRPL